MLLAQIFFPPQKHAVVVPDAGKATSSLMTDQALSIQDLRLPQALCVTYKGPKVSVLLIYKSNGPMQNQNAQHRKAKRGTYDIQIFVLFCRRLAGQGRPAETQRILRAVALLSKNIT